MKRILVLLTIGVFFSLSINAQKTERFLTSKIISGCQSEI